MARVGTPEWHRRVTEGTRRGKERRRERLCSRPRDLERLRRDGFVAESLRPIVEIAEEEAGEIMRALGGVDSVTAQKRILIEDLCAVGIALRGTLALYLQEPDPELGSRLSTMASTRRSSLALLGLERFEREIDLSSYLAQKSAEIEPGDANGSGDEPVVEEGREVQGERSEASVVGLGGNGPLGGQERGHERPAPSESLEDPQGSGSGA